MSVGGCELIGDRALFHFLTCFMFYCGLSIAFDERVHKHESSYHGSICNTDPHETHDEDNLDLVTIGVFADCFEVVLDHGVLIRVNGANLLLSSLDKDLVFGQHIAL